MAAPFPPRCEKLSQSIHGSGGERERKETDQSLCSFVSVCVSLIAAAPTHNMKCTESAHTPRFKNRSPYNMHVLFCPCLCQGKPSALSAYKEIDFSWLLIKSSYFPKTTILDLRNGWFSMICVSIALAFFKSVKAFCGIPYGIPT